MMIKQYCQYKGIMCSLATEFGYCNLTACINREAMNQEHKTGKWTRMGWSIKCSECGYDMPFAARNYCPSCGAKMKGVNDAKY